ncbi:hypothetical protein [Microbispora sp. H10830]|nr:hypothetical protein [Microbispora sp. H10830]
MATAVLIGRDRRADSVESIPTVAPLLCGPLGAGKAPVPTFDRGQPFGVLPIRRHLPLVDLAYHDLFMIALITLILLLGGFICLALAVFKEDDRLRLVAAGLACWLLAELVQRVYELLILQP